MRMTRWLYLAGWVLLSYNSKRADLYFPSGLVRANDEEGILQEAQACRYRQPPREVPLRGMQPADPAIGAGATHNAAVP